MPDCVNDIYMYKDAQEDFLNFQPLLWVNDELWCIN